MFDRESALKAVRTKPDPTEAVARAVEAELDRDFEVWLDRWTSPAGLFTDAPEPPKSRYTTSPERIGNAAIAAYEATMADAGWRRPDRDALFKLIHEAIDSVYEPHEVCPSARLMAGRVVDKLIQASQEESEGWHGEDRKIGYED